MQEISLNILDIAQNSIRAGALLTQIIINEDHKEDLLTVEIIDNGSGMSEEQLLNVTDPFFTTRTTRSVGLGVPFFKMAAEQTGGFFEIKSTLGEGTYLKAAFKHSHIDRMPLGDMCSSICIIIRMNKDIDFLYRHTIDGKSFELDTCTIRETLGDVPIDEPDVMAWIEEYIKENTAQINNQQ